MVRLRPEASVARRWLCLIVILVGSLSGCPSESPPPSAADDGLHHSAATPTVPHPAANTPDTSPRSSAPSSPQPNPAAAEAVELPVPEPSTSEPVTAAMQIRPPTAAPGATVELVIVARIARAHFLHADEADATFTATAVQGGAAGGGRGARRLDLSRAGQRAGQVARLPRFGPPPPFAENPPRDSGPDADVQRCAPLSGLHRRALLAPRETRIVHVPRDPLPIEVTP